MASVSHSVSASCVSQEMVSAFFLRQRGGLESPVTRHPVPGFLSPLPLTWGAAGAAGLVLGFVVLLFLVPAGLVLRVVWGHLQGEMEEGKNYSGASWGGQRHQRGSCPDTSSLSKTAPTHLHSPSLTSWGWDAARRPKRPSMSGPQARPRGEAAQGRRMAASRPNGWRA